jgi:TolB-like protein/DNA-binding winged helix-turn-helix (wHTH) protein/Flp pilus assembly protein TadD
MGFQLVAAANLRKTQNVKVCAIGAPLALRLRRSPGGGRGATHKGCHLTALVFGQPEGLSMTEHPPTRETVHFENFEFDFRSGELRENGHKVKVQGQPLQILAVLLERPGDVITRDEIRNNLWPGGTFVDFEHSLNAAVKRLRQAIHDSAEHPRLVETLARRGYRFIGDIAAQDTPVATTEPSTSDFLTPADHGQPEDTRKTAAVEDRPWPLAWKVWAFALLIASSIVVGWALRYGKASSPAIRSIAVLPLESLSDDASQDYFADGMTDELITDLGQISSLRVISRTSVMSYKGTRKPLPQIARELGVDAIVEGTVLRSGGQVRITAQLIEASADKHLWAHSYEGDLRDTLALQNKVARTIAEQIRINLTPREDTVLRASKVVNPEAYEAYLKGRYFWNKRTADGLKRAIEYFKGAIETDPTYAPAYSGLADSYSLSGDWEYGLMAPKDAFPSAKAAAKKALELDNTLGEAHASLAFCNDVFDWDWGSADREFRQAIELNPGYATAHQWYGWHLVVMGHSDDAIAELRKAESLDPLSLIISADIADALLIARRYDQAMQQSRKTLELDPNFALAHYQLGQAMARQKMYDEAIVELRKAIDLSGDNSTFASNLAYVYAVSGKKEEATKILNDLKTRDHPFSNSSEIALIYAGLNDKDQAMAWLQKAFDERFNPSILKRPCFDALRSDPRFQDLLVRIGISE